MKMLRKLIFITIFFLGLALIKPASAQARVSLNLNFFTHPHIHLRPFPVVKNQRQNERISRLADRATERFTHHHDQLQRIIDRIGSNVTKLQNSGKDMSAVQNNLDTAKKDLANADQLGQNAAQKIHDLASKSPSITDADRTAVRTAVQSAQQAYVQVVKDLRTTIETLKASL